MNAMVYVRGNKYDYDEWAAMGNKDWSYKKVLKYFKKSEKNLNPEFVEYKNGKYHSASGPMAVSLFPKNPFAHIFIEAGKEKCIDVIPDINADKTLGFVNFQGTFDGVRRVSSAKAFLVPAKNRPNLHVIKKALVKKVIFDENKRAIGVEFDYDGKKNMTAYARKEVVLSAGVIGSAQLLLLSGVGPKADLEKLNINPICDLSVGKNLMDHVQTQMFYSFKPNPVSPTASLDNLYNYLIDSNGPLASIGISQLSAFLHVRNHSEHTNIQFFLRYFQVNTTALNIFMTARNFTDPVKEKLSKENAVNDIALVLVVLLKPKSRGYMKLKTASPYDKPIIRPEYFTHPEDVSTMVRAVQYQYSFHKTKAFKKYGGKYIRFPLEKCDRFDFSSEDYWNCYIHQLSNSIYHPVGRKLETSLKLRICTNNNLL